MDMAALEHTLHGLRIRAATHALHPHAHPQEGMGQEGGQEVGWQEAGGGGELEEEEGWVLRLSSRKQDPILLGGKGGEGGGMSRLGGLPGGARYLGKLTLEEVARGGLRRDAEYVLQRSLCRRSEADAQQAGGGPVVASLFALQVASGLCLKSLLPL
jgi:hypothetical protein